MFFLIIYVDDVAGTFDLLRRFRARLSRHVIRRSTGVHVNIPLDILLAAVTTIPATLMIERRTCICVLHTCVGQNTRGFELNCHGTVKNQKVWEVS